MKTQTTPNIPFHHFKCAIAQRLIDDKLFCAEWFKSQNARLSLYWESMETVDSAYYMIHCFAEAALSKNVCRAPSVDILRSIGCEFEGV